MHVADDLRPAVVEPARVSIVGLDGLDAAAREFGSFAIWIDDVVQKPGRQLRNAIIERGVKTASYYGLDVQIIASAERFNCLGNYLLRFGVRRRSRLGRLRSLSN